MQQIIEYEEEVYKSIRSFASKSWSKILEKEPKLQSLNVLEMPGLVAAYNEITSSSGLKKITPQLAFKLYDAHGLDEHTINSLCKSLNLPFDPKDLKAELENARAQSKQGCAPNHNLENIIQVLNKNEVPKTDDSFKYKYKSYESTYVFDSVEAVILSVVKEGKVVQGIEADLDCYLVLNRTNLYSEAGGQISDKGHILFKDGKIFTVEETYKLNGYIFHKGVLLNNDPGGTKLLLKVGESGNVFVNEDNRLKCMTNHTATHLLNAALKNVVSCPTCQKSTKISSELLSFDVGIYGKKLSVEDIEKVEQLICQTIKKGVDIQIKHINSQKLLEFENITMVPGEVYPDVGIRIIEIEDGNCFSR